MKKLLRNCFAYTLVFAMLFNFVAPIDKVFADGTFNVGMTIQVANDSDATLVARNGEGPVANGSAGNQLQGTRNEVDGIVGFINTATQAPISDENVTVTCTTNKLCNVTVVVPNGQGVKVVVGGDVPFGFTLAGNPYDNSPLADGSVLDIVNREIQPAFDGKAYLVWSCGNRICYHLFEGLTNDMSYVNANTVTDVTDPTKKFDVNAESKFFTSVDNFTSKKAQIDANSVAIGDLIGPDGIDFEPVNEPTANNAYISYGGRNFKVTVYNSDFRGVSIGDLNELTYYPSSWTDPLVKTEAYDVSGTSKENPVDIETVLLESTVTIKTLGVVPYTIDSIEALDVPEGAVVVNKVDGKFKIKFNSNFFDKVVFKVTTSDSKTYYFRIVRFTFKVKDTVIYPPNINDLDFKADFYFDRTTSYKDYVITATIEYKDGTTKVVEMENAKEVENELGEKTYAYEVDDQTNPVGPDHGKGLKIATYHYKFTNGEVKKVSKVYINVEFKGSTSTKYAGAFAGSGKGKVVTFKEGGLQ